jgi:2-dehydro-3-deoxyphosphogluconate aldolase/(4S)-4-hydroxy-2-oxoglutarate aldolase
MLRMMRVLEIVEAQVLRRLGQARVIALAEFEDAEQAEAAGAALLAGGCASVEVQCGHLAVLRAARAVEGLTVGAGNVRSGEDVELAVRAGAQFATATATNTEIVRACRELELPFFPGVTTPTEIERLALLGVRVMRVFPATPLGGPAYLQALAECYPELRFIPSGGIGPEQIRGYLRIPSVVAVGVGGLLAKELLRSQSYSRIEWLAREAVRGAEPQFRPVAAHP